MDQKQKNPEDFFVERLAKLKSKENSVSESAETKTPPSKRKPDIPSSPKPSLRKGSKSSDTDSPPASAKFSSTPPKSAPKSVSADVDQMSLDQMHEMLKAEEAKARKELYDLDCDEMIRQAMTAVQSSKNSKVANGKTYEEEEEDDDDDEAEKLAKQLTAEAMMEKELGIDFEQKETPKGNL